MRLCERMVASHVYMDGGSVSLSGGSISVYCKGTCAHACTEPIPHIEMPMIVPILLMAAVIHWLPAYPFPHVTAHVIDGSPPCGWPSCMYMMHPPTHPLITVPPPLAPSLACAQGHHCGGPHCRELPAVRRLCRGQAEVSGL